LLRIGGFNPGGFHTANPARDCELFDRDILQTNIFEHLDGPISGARFFRRSSQTRPDFSRQTIHNIVAVCRRPSPFQNVERCLADSRRCGRRNRFQSVGLLNDWTFAGTRIYRQYRYAKKASPYERARSDMHLDPYPFSNHSKQAA
jgi:hypothetical protein